MPFLYQTLDSLRAAGFMPSMPSYIADNINPALPLRPYQKEAFENFVAYFENPKLCTKPTQTLFHMATGSGKTLMMAGLIVYLYQKGYRNFLFFVHRSQIVKKTKENFLNQRSHKYLFAPDVIIDSCRVKINEVDNFQTADPNAINICFTTIQGLSSDIWNVKENAISLDDFYGKKVVLISDEAHHLNADTKNPSAKESEDYHSWESTVKHIFNSCKDNVLLEFTATCDLNNRLVKEEYLNKIIFDYPLSKFRDDKYSKEIKTLRSDLSVLDKSLQALILSQYRMKVFQENRCPIKPVVLFKATKVKKSEEFQLAFNQMITSLDGNAIKKIEDLNSNDTVKSAFDYFQRRGISYNQLAQELKNDFSPEHCISANDDSDIEMKQIILNTLEDQNNPYRAVFEVEKLDEGWDVLNLYDIVRISDQRQSGGKKISATTISEAQLIGRGARYCPFEISNQGNKYIRKYDDDITNPLRICEELYYHCQNDSKYITELNSALREIGLDPEGVVSRQLALKQSFKDDDIYKQGLIFINNRELVSRNEVYGIPQNIIDREYSIAIQTGRSGEDILLSTQEGNESTVKNYTTRISIKEIAEFNYSIVNKALCRFPILKFNLLKQYFPNLKSTREFITSHNYLGDIKIAITSMVQEPSPKMLLDACVSVMSKISEHILSIKETYIGSNNFRACKIHDVFKDKVCNYTNPHDGGVGISQNDSTVPTQYKIDLSREDWYAFEDNYGTSEEKAFVAYFRTFIPQIKAKYSKAFLVRNEKQFAIYSFDDGGKFEPDYILFLQKDKALGFEQIQVFIEPKGAHLIPNDLWKETFMLKMDTTAVALRTFVDDNDYKIWGFHFFNQTERTTEFQADMQKILDY